MKNDSILTQVGLEMGISRDELEQIAAELERFEFQATAFDDTLLNELLAGTDELLESLGLPPPRDPRCQAKNRRGERCQMQAIEDKRVCKFHGGLSTGAKTAAGREAIRESNRRRAKPRPLETPAQSLPEAQTDKGAPPDDGLTGAQRLACTLLWNGRQTNEQIARKCGVSRRTLARWKHLPAFNANYNALMEAYNAEQEVRWQATLKERFRKER